MSDNKFDEQQDELQRTARISNMIYSSSSGGSDDAGEEKQAQIDSSTSEHRRNISWGSLNFLPRATRQQSDASAPSVTFETPGGAGNLDVGQTIPEDTNVTYRPTIPARRTVIELPDGLGIVNPMEAEAETYLIRAIENAVSETQQTLLSNVPDEAVGHALSDAHDAAGSVPPDARSTSKMSVPPASVGAQSTKSPTSTTRIPKPTKHIRKQTLDEQLFGLTQAIETIQGENFAPLEEEVPLTSRTNTLEFEGMPFSGNDEAANLPNPSYDVFPNATDKMYHQTRPGEVGMLSTVYRRNRTESNVDQNEQVNPEVGGSRQGDYDDEEKGITSSEANDTTSAENKKGNGGRNYRGDKVRNGIWGRVNSLLWEEWGIASDIRDFLRPKRTVIYLYLQLALGYIVIPSLAAANILFYAVDNPPTGRLVNNGIPVDGKLMNTNGEEVNPSDTSISYYLLFAGVRQVITLSLALGTQLFAVEFLLIDRAYLFKFGARLPLFIMQARGWPFVLFVWSMFNWALLAGKHPFFSHWLHFQSSLAVFNASNPDGGLVNSTWNHRILSVATAISLVAAAKRFWVGIFLGKQTYYQYSDKLASALRKILLICQVATLSRQIVSTQGRKQLLTREAAIFSALTEEKIGGLMDDAEDSKSGGEGDESVSFTTRASDPRGGPLIDPHDRSPLTGKLSSTQKNRIVRLLGAWEEPSELFQTSEQISVSSLMHFRRAMGAINTEFPFSASFGPAATREDCITSAQEVFRRLVLFSDYDDVLNFEVLALLGAKADGSLDHDTLKELIQLFRPDRDGSLSMVHFVRSVDKVYKEIRLLRASVSNSLKVDGQFEAVFDVGFYTVVLVVALYALGIDPLALFVSMSGLAVSISFSKCTNEFGSVSFYRQRSLIACRFPVVIGTASAKYFQGLLFILVRRPYAIGDCIHISAPNEDSSSSKIGFWTVEDITLFSTQVVSKTSVI